MGHCAIGFMSPQDPAQPHPGEDFLKAANNKALQCRALSGFKGRWDGQTGPVRESVTAAVATTAAAFATTTPIAATWASAVGAAETATTAFATTVAAAFTTPAAVTTAAFATAAVAATATFAATAITAAAFTTTTAVAATATKAATPCTGRTCFHGTGFIDHHITTTQWLAIHAVDGSLRFIVAAHFHKTEAFGAASVTFHHDFGAGDSTEFTERLFQIAVANRVRQVADVKFVAHERDSSKHTEKSDVALKTHSTNLKTSEGKRNGSGHRKHDFAASDSKVC